MSDERQQWSLQGEGAARLPADVRALAEHWLTRHDGDPLLALLDACRAVGVLRSATSYGILRAGLVAGGEIMEALDVMARAGREGIGADPASTQSV